MHLCANSSGAYAQVYISARDEIWMRLLWGFSAKPSFNTYVRVEPLLVKALNSQDNSTELQFMEKCTVMMLILKC